MSSKNNGMRTLNELFAMKKNMAFQANFENKMTSMRKDFYQKRNNLKQVIKSTVHEMKEIQLSTGYSLDEDQKSRNQEKTPRKSVVYFPPIGMKLVKKYVGLDMQKLPRFLSTLPRFIDRRKEETTPKARPDHIEPDQDETKQLAETTANCDFVVSNGDLVDARINSNTLPKIVVTEPSSDSIKHENNTDIAETENDMDDDVFAETNDTNLSAPVRRSSRTTFRTRTSLRFLSQPSLLEEHNLHVISMSKASKAKSLSTNELDNNIYADFEKLFEEYAYSEVKPREPNKTLSSNSLTKTINFCLDYGDGKLHDTLKIPKVKDCSRPWCNPFCKTCQLRTTSRPCFVLIPYEGKEPPRKIANKRRPSMFPVYRTVNGDNKEKLKSTDGTESDRDIAKSKRENALSKSTMIENINKSLSSSLETITGEIEKDPDDKVMSESVFEEPSPADMGKHEEDLVDNIKPLQYFRRKKGYSKKRMEELSQPRGGHPAEVRFSKASLRRKKEEMKETERTKELSFREQQHLAFIQGKISHFLAMLNQQEVIKKPKRMVDIPIREVIDSDKLIHEAKKRKKLKEEKTGRIRQKPHSVFQK